MPKAIYTIAKGLFESGDSDSGFEISSGVSHQCVAIPETAVKRIRIFQQNDDTGGDSFADLDEKLITLGNVAFELDNDGDDDQAGGGDVSILLNGLDLTTADPHDIAALIATAINNDASSAIYFAIADAATTVVDTDNGIESLDDYADVTIYSHVTGTTFALSTTMESTHGSVAKLSGPTSSTRSFAGSFYLAAGRADDVADVEADDSLNIGSLDDGGNAGETILLLNNSSERKIDITGTFSGGASATLSEESGVLLAWNGAAWATVKSYGTFA